MKRFSNRSGQQGLSLIELMIALVLGLLVVAAVIQLFIGTRVTYTVTSGLARVQENARFALEVMNRDIRMAGSGAICGGTQPLQTKVWVDPAAGGIGELLGFDIGIRGWEFTGTGNNDTVTFDPADTAATTGNWSDGSSGLPGFLLDFDNPALPDSDVLGIRTSDPAANVTGCPSKNNNTTSTSLQTCEPPDASKSADHGVGQGQPFAVVDCQQGFMDVCINTAKQKADTLVCSNGSGNKKTGGEWLTVYGSDMELHRPTSLYYFVAASASDDERRALYRASNCPGDGCQVEELVEGVESLQLFYRVAGDTNLYAADSLPSGSGWADVRGVAMHLIVGSPEQVDSRQLQQTLVLDNGLEFEINDRRVRQLYTNTVAIRNAITVN